MLQRLMLMQCSLLWLLVCFAHAITTAVELVVSFNSTQYPQCLFTGSTLSGSPKLQEVLRRNPLMPGAFLLDQDGCEVTSSEEAVRQALIVCSQRPPETLVDEPLVFEDMLTDMRGAKPHFHPTPYWEQYLAPMLSLLRNEGQSLMHIR